MRSNNDIMENQTPNVPAVTTEVVVDQPKQSNFLIILLSSLLIISVAIAGFFAFQTQKLVKELTLLRIEPTPIATIIPTTEPVATSSSMIVDPTANWKTYTNKQYGFSMKYPSIWKDETGQDVIANGNREFRFKTEKNEYINGVIFDGPTGYIQKLEDWEKKIDIKNGDFVFISYTDNIGPGSKGGVVDIDIFNTFVSTLQSI